MEKLVRKPMVYAISIVLAIVVIGGSYAGYTALTPAVSPSPSPSASPPPASNEYVGNIHEQVRDETIAYIGNHHDDATSYVQEITGWTGQARQSWDGKSESATYSSASESSSFWVVEIQNPLVTDPTYTVNVRWSNPLKPDVSITWTGTWQGGSITETNYISNINAMAEPPEQVQVLDDVMGFIKTTYVETDPYINDLNWTGGRVDTGLVDAEKYVYTTLHGALGDAWWTVDIGSPVVADPTYTVTASYIQTGVPNPAVISWTGTWQNGTITTTTFYTSNIIA